MNERYEAVLRVASARAGGRRANDILPSRSKDTADNVRSPLDSIRSRRLLSEMANGDGEMKTRYLSPLIILLLRHSHLRPARSLASV
jgi:hypothetical protein